jgi:hypothetical protein
VPNRTDAAAASEKPRGDVRNWAHCADEDEAISGPNHQPNSIVTADRLRCGARVCRRDAELFCNTSAVRHVWTAPALQEEFDVAAMVGCGQVFGPLSQPLWLLAMK